MKKTRKFRFDRLIYVLFSITMFTYLLSSIVLKSFNVSLAAKQKAAEKQIVELKSEVDTFSAQVKELSDYNRVIDIINDSQMNNINASFVDITN